MQVRRNIVSLQLVVDPLSLEGLQLVSVALQMWSQGTCARIGALFSADIDAAADADVVSFSDLSLQGQFVRCVAVVCASSEV